MTSLQNLSWVNEMKKEGRAKWHVLLLCTMGVEQLLYLGFFVQDIFFIVRESSEEAFLSVFMGYFKL